MNTVKTINTVVINSPVQEELAKELALAIERNRKQRACEFWNDDTMLAWGITISNAKKQAEMKKGRVHARLSRAVLVAPIASETKGHAMSKAFKPIEFTFDSKTGIVTPMTGETPERVQLLKEWAYRNGNGLVKKYIDGLHMIANGKRKEVRGFDQFRDTKNEKIISFVTRYNGTNTADKFENTPLAKDADKAYSPLD